MNNIKKEIPKIQKKLKQKLSESRFQHTLGVAYTSGCLAMKYGVDVDKAIVAGLLHDCAKYMSNEEMLQIANKQKFDISEAELNKPDLLHAKVGAYISQKKYSIDDSEILNAIKCHTTGKPDMTLFEKILYISDYIEPARYKMPRLEEIRRTAFEDIDKCLKMILSDSVDYLKNSGMFIDDTTIKTYEFYVNN